MEYIKLNREIETDTGFIATEAIAAVTNYNINENRVLGQTGTTRNTNINFLYYKSIDDKQEGMQPINPLSNEPAPVMHGIVNVSNDVVTDATVYGYVLDHLTANGYPAAELISM